jgi:acyl-CoA synthetase (AMP-forming)/AMP-acid ligase II
VGIRDFVENLKKHRDLLSRSPGNISPEEREEALGEAELMVGMAEAASRELGSVLANRRPNLPEEHALRFAQEVFAHLAAEEEAFKESLRSSD